MSELFIFQQTLLKVQHWVFMQLCMARTFQYLNRRTSSDNFREVFVISRMDVLLFVSSLVAGASVIWFLFRKQKTEKQQRSSQDGFIKVVSYNVYLVPSFVVKKLSAVNTCVKQGHRSQGNYSNIANLISLKHLENFQNLVMCCYSKFEFSHF